MKIHCGNTFKLPLFCTNGSTPLTITGAVMRLQDEAGNLLAGMTVSASFVANIPHPTLSGVTGARWDLTLSPTQTNQLAAFSAVVIDVDVTDAAGDVWQGFGQVVPVAPFGGAASGAEFVYLGPQGFVVITQAGLHGSGGGETYPLQFGDGYMRFGAFVAQTLSPYDATAGAANAASVPLYMRPGRGTGNGDGAGVVIQVAQPGDSGADPHNLVDAYELGVTQLTTSNPLRLPDRTEGDPVGAGITEGSFAVAAGGKLLAAVAGLWVDRSGTRDYNELLNTPALGTAALLNVPASGNASSGQVVLGSDTRLNETTIVTLQNITTAFPKPDWAKWIICEIWGQGGAAGSGRKGAAGTVACGGGAGSSAMYVKIGLAAAEVGATIACVVPGSPAGGAAVTTDSTDGNTGAPRTNTTVQVGQYTIVVPGGVPGSGGTASTGVGGTSSGTAFTLPFISVAGVVGASASGAFGLNGGNNSFGNPGSGAGGGVSAANTAAAGGGGGYCQISNTQISGGTGGAVGANGTQGTAPLGFHGGGGAGGGGGAVTGAAGNGANAVGYGGAGGGGGGARNGVGNSSGKGGDGTPGTVRLTFIP